MNSKLMYALGAAILLGAAFAAYLFWPNSQSKPEVASVAKAPSAPAPAAPSPPPVPAPASAIIPVKETPPPLPPLPHLANSDKFVIDSLAGLISNSSLMKSFYSERVIRKIVVSIVDLTQHRVPVNVMPFKPPVRHFLTEGSEGNLTISPKNEERYSTYVKIAEVTDAKRLVELYVRLYPLFQQSYESLGYHKKFFNDQLIETLDDLLETPDISEPIKLVQPKYFYLYADADVEELSIGQKIMLRLGNKNLKLVRNKLNEIKQELSLHTNELKR